jgi:hypothetical protein
MADHVLHHCFQLLLDCCRGAFGAHIADVRFVFWGARLLLVLAAALERCSEFCVAVRPLVRVGQFEYVVPFQLVQLFLAA